MQEEPANPEEQVDDRSDLRGGEGAAEDLPAVVTAEELDDEAEDAVGDEVNG